MSFSRPGCVSPVLALMGGALAGTLLMPGALVTFAVASAADVKLDAGQAWTFAAAGSFVLYLGAIGLAGGVLRGSARFLLLSVSSVMAVAVAAFGLHAEWPVAFAQVFLGGSK